MSTSHAGSAGGTERRRSRSGVEPADPAAPPGDDRPSGGFVNGADSDDEDLILVDDYAVDPARDAGPSLPPLARSRQRPKALSKPAGKAEALRPEQRLLLLDTWLRSGLPAGDFAALVGLSKHTLYAWKKKFDRGRAGRVDGPAQAADRPAAGCRS